MTTRPVDRTAITAPSAAAPSAAVAEARATAASAARPTTRPLPVVGQPRPPRPLADFIPLPAPTWQPAPRRARPGKAPLTGRAAEVGRYLQQHLDKRRDDELTARVVLDHLIEGGLSSLPAPAAAARLGEALNAVRSLRQAGLPHLEALDAPCPGEPECGQRMVPGPAGPQDELCEAHWTALGGWWAVQAVHVRELLRLGGPATP